MCIVKGIMRLAPARIRSSLQETSQGPIGHRAVHFSSVSLMCRFLVVHLSPFMFSMLELAHAACIRGVGSLSPFGLWRGKDNRLPASSRLT